MAFSQVWYYFLIMAVVSYLIGCINFALIISKFKKNDITKIGSGNPGTLNMSREFGLKIGLLTLILDIIKGGVPTLVGFLIFKDINFAGTEICIGDLTKYICGLSVVFGHIYPVTLKFRGGKGIASTLGVFAFALCCEGWYYIFVVLGVGVITIVYIIKTEWGSMGSLIAVTIFAFIQGVIFYLDYYTLLLNGYIIACFMLLFMICFITWVAHRKNLFKLLAGEEHHTSVKKLSKNKTKAKKNEEASV